MCGVRQGKSAAAPARTRCMKSGQAPRGLALDAGATSLAAKAARQFETLLIDGERVDDVAPLRILWELADRGDCGHKRGHLMKITRIR